MMSSILLLKSMLFASVLQKTNNMRKKKKKIKAKKAYSVKNISSMCRVCNQDDGVIPIFGNQSEPNISKEIENFTGVIISQTDNLPKQLCQKCLDLLNGCVTFRDMCQRTNKQMIELSIKKEININKCNKTLHKYECTSNNSNEVLVNSEQLHNFDENTVALQESEESYNLPSPSFSLDNSEIWGCRTCNKEFYDMDSYNSHLSECMDNTRKSDTQKQPKGKSINRFLCDVCGKVSRSNANLLIHMSIHSSVFPYKCEQCPYQGRTMDLLKTHKRSHMLEKPFKCTQCPKTASSASNLKKHMRHVHSTSRPYKCSYCDKAFSYQYDMKKHVRDIHLRQGTVECDLCFKKFNTKKILQGHRVKIHKIKGDRHGRIPSYLQCQLEEQNKNENNQWQRIDNDTCEPLQ